MHSARIHTHGKRQTGSRGTPRGRRLTAEPLESRRLMAVLPFPELQQAAPLGAQIWSGEASESLSNTGDTDQFQLSLAADQVLSVAVRPIDPALDVALVIRGPNNAVIAEASSRGAGVDEWSNGLLLTAAGLYTLELRSMAGGGRYAVDLLLNATFELESLTGAANDTVAGAEPLPAFRSLAPGAGAAVASVVGERPAIVDELLHVNFEAGMAGFTIDNTVGLGRGQWHLSTLRAGDLGHSSSRSLYFGARDGSGYADDAEGTVTSPTVDLRGIDGRVELAFNYLLDAEEFLDLASVEIVGTAGVKVVADNSLLGNLVSTGSVFRPLTVDLTEFVGQEIRVRFHFVSDFVVSYEGFFVDDVVIRQVRAPAADLFRVDLNAGELVSFAVAAQSGQTTHELALYDASGQRLAVGMPSDSTPVRAIHQFVPAQAGTFYVQVQGSPGDYGLTVTRGADFNAETGVEPAASQRLSPASRVLGSVGQGALPLPQEDEPNDDGLFGAIEDDLPLANDLSGSFVAVGADYQAKVNGTLEARSGASDIDVYRFRASPGDSVKLALEGLGLGDPLLELYDRGGRLLASDDDGGPGLDSLLIYDRFPYAGDFYIVARSYDLGTGDYALTATLTTAALLRPIDEDLYRIWLNAGSAVTLTTFTPGPQDAAAWPSNGLDPRLELFTSSGLQVAADNNSAPDGRNAVVTFTASQAGEYVVRVTAEQQTAGEYVLGVDGDASPPGVAVKRIEPSLLRPLNTNLSHVDFELSEGVLLSEVTAADLEVDGKPADAVEVLAGNRLRFSFAPLSEGKHTLHVPAGALVSLDGRPGTEYSAELVVDTTAPRIVGSSVQAGEVLVAGPVTFEFTFDEPLAAVAAEDFSLVGTLHGDFKPTSWNYDAASAKLQLFYASLPDDSYSLTLRAADGAFEDIAGNDLDGEALEFPLPPNRSGDGQPGGDFQLPFTLDATIAQFPLPLERADPPGSLIYTGQARGMWSQAGDVDRYDLQLEAGQSLAVVVSTEVLIETSVELRDSAGTVLAASSAAAGAPLVLPGVRLPAAGIYSIATTSPSGRGAYTIDVSLNAVLEQEGLSPSAPANDTLATAQPLAQSAVDLPGGGDRLAVFGRQEESERILLERDFETGQGGFSLNNRVGQGNGQWTRSTHRANEPGHSGVGSLHFGRGPNNVYDNFAEGEAISPRIDLTNVTGRIELSFNYLLSVEAPYDEARVEITGNNGRTTLASSTDGTLAQSPGQFRNAKFDITEFAGQSVRVRFYFVSDILYAYEGWYVDDVIVREVQPATPDYYAFELAAGQAATLALFGEGASDPRVELFDAQGAPLAAGVPAANVASYLGSYVAPAAGVYYARVLGGRDPYGLLVTRGAGFDRERNDGLETAQELPRDGTVLGYIPRADDTPPAAAAPVNGSGENESREEPLASRPEHGSRRPVAVDAAPNRLIVAFDPQTSRTERDKLIAQSGYATLAHLTLINAVVLAVPGEGEQLLREAARWSKEPGVLYAEPDYVLSVDATRPNDPLFGSLWGLDNTGQTGGTPGADIGGSTAWDVARGSSQVVVAVIDSGVDYRHVDLAANIWTNPGEIPGDGIDNDGNGFIDDLHGIDTANDDTDPYDDAGHGTHVAGTIGAVGNNGIGVAGVNWNVQIMPLKFLSALGTGFTSDAIAAIDYLTLMKNQFGVNLVASNNSWSGGAYSQALYEAISASTEAGILFVAAAGNSGSNSDQFAEYPAAYDLPGILSVAATDANDALADFSNFGEISVDLAAPGVDILSTTPDNTYDTYSGTSMAAPHVTGVAALLKSLSPDLSPEEIKAALLSTADQRPGLAGKVASEGRLNAARAVALFGEPADWYRLSVSAGDQLVLTTFTPGDAPGEFTNALDPLLELYDAAGNRLASDRQGAADGRNALLSYTASAAGTLFVRVASESGGGEYVLQVAGATGPRSPFAVVAADKVDGARLNASPGAVTISFSDLVALPTLAAGDLTIDGLPATGVEIVDGQTLRFLLPALAEGEHVLRFAADAMTDLRSTPLDAWESRFVVDLTAPRIVSASISPGEVLPAGAIEFVAKFNEPLASGSLDASDVLLIGENTGKQRIESLSYDPVTSTLKIVFPLLADDNYLLRLLSGDRQFEDLVGWNLDGDAPGVPLPPAVSGNGQPGGDFTVSFTVDVETQPFRGPLRPVLPLGSLVYTGEMSALIATPGDRDTYLVELSVGQSLSLVATGTGGLTPTIDVSDVGGAVLNTAVAPAAGTAAVVQTLTAASAGAYRVTVGGAAGTMGAYRLQVVVNAAVELESQGGAANNAASSAQSLDGAFIPLGPGADRAAVVGDQFPPTATLFRENFENGLGGFTIDNDFELGDGQWHRSLGRAHDAGHSASHSLYFGANEREEGGGLYAPLLGGAVLSPEIDLRDQTGRLELRFNYFLEADGVGDLARVDALVNGVATPLANNLGLGNLSDFTESFRTAVIDISQFKGQRVQFRFAFASDFFAELEGWYVDDVEVRALIEPSPDVYAVTLEQGQAATLALKKNGGPEMTLDVLDAAGQVVATSGQRGSNLDQVIHDFVAPTAGVYHVRVRGGSTEYALLVTRGAGFDHERNDELAHAQDLGPTDSALGHVIGGGKPAGSAPTSGLGAAVVQPAAPGTSRLIVRFDDALASLSSLKSLGVPVKRAGGLSLVGANLFDVPTENLPSVLDAWRQAPGVRYVEPDYRLQLLDTVPNDPRFGELYGLNNTGQTGGALGSDIDAPQAWDISTGSSDVVIVSIDTGIDYRHEDLAANMWVNPGEIPDDGLDNDGNGYIDDIYGIDTANGDSDPFDDNGHGTHTAGTMAGVGNNGIGVTGIAWNAKLMALKFLSGAGNGSTSDAIAAIQYMTMMKTRYGVNIVVSNNSWGGGEASEALREAIAASIDAGILFVAAAGNLSSNNDQFPNYPASFDLPGIVSVAATDHRDVLASFSNYGGNSVDLAAPGVDILSTTPNNTYSRFSGTSMAAPHVAGVAALLADVNPGLMPRELAEILSGGADRLPQLAGQVKSGGRLNAVGSLALAGQPNDWYRFSATAGEELVIRTDTPAWTSLEADNILDPLIELYDASGALIARSDNSAADGMNVRLGFVAPTAGEYFVRVLAARGRGEYLLTVDRAAAVPGQVTAVELAGADWSESFVAQLQQQAAGKTGFGLPAASGFSAPLPWGNLNRITLRFNQPMQLAADDLLIARLDDPTRLIAFDNFVYDAATRTATWTTKTPLVRGQYVLGLSTDVRDMQGRPLDGEWRAAAEYPSGDGSAGGRFLLRFSVLQGDADRSGHVDLGDFGLIKTAFGGASVWADFDGDGRVTLTDFGIFKLNFDSELPRTVFTTPGGETPAATRSIPTRVLASDELDAVEYETLNDLALSAWAED